MDVKHEKQVIVEIGAEGGSLILFGIESPGGWRFRVETDESGMLDDEEILELPVRPWVATWHGALEQLDSYPWTQLYPLTVHPEFSDLVFQALHARANKDLVIDWGVWGHALKGAPPLQLWER